MSRPPIAAKPPETKLAIAAEEDCAGGEVVGLDPPPEVGVRALVSTVVNNHVTFEDGTWVGIVDMVNSLLLVTVGMLVVLGAGLEGTMVLVEEELLEAWMVVVEPPSFLIANGGLVWILVLSLSRVMVQP